MDLVDDSALLRRYAEDQSDEAFATLVARHINLVYSVALRHVGSPENAEEITQAVFIILAKKAPSLRHDKALSSWLFQTTRLTAANFIRSESRRSRREQEAYMQSMSNNPGEDVWPKLAPLLDRAVADLREKDRRAILLRFYEGKNLREVGLALGASEDAAEKRVGRALEKIRKFFLKQGVNSSAATLSGMITAHSVHLAPATLAKSVTVTAIGKGAASGPILALVKGALNVMAWTKAKTSLAVAAAILLAAGTTVLLMNQASLASIDGTFRSVIFKHRYEQYAKRFEGTWQGDMAMIMQSSGWTQHRRLVVKILEVDGDYRALVDDPSDGVKNIIVPKVTLDELSINFAAHSFTYRGVFHKNATEIRGAWSQAGLGSFLLVLTRTNTPTELVSAQLSKQDYTPRAGSDLQGLWQGVVTNKSDLGQVYLKIAEDINGKFRGEFTVPGHTPLIPYPVSGIGYTNPSVSFAALSVGCVFVGTLSDDHSSMRGQWKWTLPGRGTKVSHIVWTRVKPEAADELQAKGDFNYSRDAELQGHWSAAFPAKFGVPLGLGLNIAKLTDGKFSATVDSPDQELFEMPPEVFEFKPPRLRIDSKLAHATFEGRLEGGKLSGQWSFYDVSAPVVFERRKP